VVELHKDDTHPAFQVPNFAVQEHIIEIHLYGRVVIYGDSAQDSRDQGVMEVGQGGALQIESRGELADRYVVLRECMGVYGNN
jgi:hypothetical protein